jgi:hypothetical protein
MEEQSFTGAEKNKKSNFNLLLIALIAVLILSNAATAYFLYQTVIARGKIAPSENVLPTVSDNISETDVNKTSDAASEGSVTITSSTSPKFEDNTSTTSPSVLKALATGEITIDWSEWPALVDSTALFDYQLTENKLKEYAEKNKYEAADLQIDEFLKKHRVYKAGRVSKGDLADSELFIDTSLPDGPAFHDTIFEIVKHGQSLILLANYSDNPWGVYEKLFNVSKEISIANIEPPEEFNVPSSSYRLIKADNPSFMLMSSYDNPQKMFSYAGYNIYKNNGGCFITSASDSTARYYYFDIAFASPKENKAEYSGVSPNLLDITWNDGTKNDNEYVWQRVGGCGPTGCYNYVDYITSVEQLDPIGETSTGEKIYTLHDKSFKPGKSEKDLFTEMYDLYYPGYDSAANATKEKTPFSDFLADRPIIYWADPFGDFIEFRNAEYLPAVECGKPVIYLYPEQEEDVSVKVFPTGGFRLTEPDYGHGWQVRAKTNGSIFNYADGKTYSYLFWEGKGYWYERPTEGFISPREELKKFFVDKLAALGLIKKEYDEFIDYWVPRMQFYPYYFITFLPAEEFDEIAPLEISPKPDTVIRVFMDYEGLNLPREAVEPVLIAPERRGFTVVEWGGAIR